MQKDNDIGMEKVAGGWIHGGRRPSVSVHHLLTLSLHMSLPNPAAPSPKPHLHWSVPACNQGVSCPSPLCLPLVCASSIK